MQVLKFFFNFLDFFLVYLLFQLKKQSFKFSGTAIRMFADSNAVFHIRNHRYATFR